MHRMLTLAQLSITTQTFAEPLVRVLVSPSGCFSFPTDPPLYSSDCLIALVSCSFVVSSFFLDVSCRTLPLTAVVDQSALYLTRGHNPEPLLTCCLTVTRLRWSRVAVDVIVFFRFLFSHKIIWLFFESISCMKIVLGKMLINNYF
jgi:hypothetical protein